MRELNEEMKKRILREQDINPDCVHIFITAHPKWAQSQLVRQRSNGEVSVGPELKGRLWASLATATWGCHRQFIERQNEMIATTHKFRLYPSDKQKREATVHIGAMQVAL